MIREHCVSPCAVLEPSSSFCRKPAHPEFLPVLLSLGPRPRLEVAISTRRCAFQPRAPGARRSGGVTALPLGDLSHCRRRPASRGRRLHSRAGPSGSLAAGRGAAPGGAPPAIQVVTGSLNRLNAEIKQTCMKKLSFSSLNVDSGLDLGASSVCRSSSRLGLVVSSTALERRGGVVSLPRGPLLFS